MTVTGLCAIDTVTCLGQHGVDSDKRSGEMSGTADVTDPVAWPSQLSAMLSSGRAVSDMSDAETLVTRHVGGELAGMDIDILH